MFGFRRKFNPENVSDWINEAKVLNETGKPEEAIKYCDRVLEIDPKNIDALNRKAWALVEIGKHEEAIKYCDRVLEIDPKHIDSLLEKAWALVELSNYEEAIKYCDRVLEIDPKNIDALNERSNAHEHIVGTFQNIISVIKSEFEPERIDSEDHLQAQLVIFLKAKFPDKRIEREFRISRGAVDIVVDEKHGFEVKVPQDRIALRNLTAQLDEYREQLESVCAIIFDDENRNLTSDINEYVDRYKKNYNIDSIVLRGKKRQFSNYS